MLVEEDENDQLKFIEKKEIKFEAGEADAAGNI